MATTATYVTVQEVKDENIDITLSDTEIQAKIKFIQEYIEKITGQFFNKRELTLNLNGSGTQILLMPIPIVEITKIEFKNIDGSYTEYDLDNFEIFNRFWPDDREYPKIEIISDLDYNYSSYWIFPEGRKNIRITGSFGYLNEDLKTPEPIKRVTKMLLMMWIGGVDSSKNNLKKSRISEEQTENYHYKMPASLVSGTLTGDNDIDNILRYYTKSGLVSIL